jgi:hypothetical protein
MKGVHRELRDLNKSAGLRANSVNLKEATSKNSLWVTQASSQDCRNPVSVYSRT